MNVINSQLKKENDLVKPTTSADNVDYYNNPLDVEIDEIHKHLKQTNIKLYSDLEQFGCNSYDEPQYIVNALPINSMFICSAGILKNSNWNLPTTAAVIEITKCFYDSRTSSSLSRVKIMLYCKTSVKGIYYMFTTIDNVISGEWEKIITQKDLDDAIASLNVSDEE